MSTDSRSLEIGRTLQLINKHSILVCHLHGIAIVSELLHFGLLNFELEDSLNSALIIYYILR